MPLIYIYRRVERHLAILEIGKAITTAGITAVTGLPNYTSLLANIPAISNSSTFDKKTQEKFWKELDKVLAEGYKLIHKEDMSKKEKPEEPTMPTASVTEMSFNGSISFSTPEFKGSDMRTPGSKNAHEITLDQPQSYPIYNERLGVFALLEKPKIDLAYFKETPSRCDVYKQYGWTEGNSAQYFKLFDVNAENHIQFSLSEPLKYTFNPKLDIKDIDIMASIEFLGTKGENGNPNRPTTSILDIDDHTKLYLTGEQDVNVESTRYIDNNNSTSQNSSALMLNDDLIWINSIPTPIDAFSSITYQFSYNQVYKSPDNFCEEYLFNNGTNPNLTVCSNPDFEDVNYFDGTDHFHAVSWNNVPGTIDQQELLEYNSSIFNNCSQLVNFFDTDHDLAPHLKLIKDSVYLKLLINVTYEGEKSDGSPHEYTYMYTYKIDTNDITESTSALNPNLQGSPGHINQYPQYLFLDGENFDGTTIEGCQLNGNTFLCKAIEEAELTGTFTVANGYNVIVEAGNEVRVLPEAITPPEMVWQIVPVWDFSNPMPPVIADSVESFCSDKGLYRANSGSKNLQQADTLSADDELDEARSQRSNFNYIIVPNPTTGDAYARVQLDEAASAALYITDLNGRKLGETTANSRLNKGQNSIQLPTAKLSKGIYLVHLIINNERDVKRLVKQ
jgi:hypothetical protein